MYRDIDVTNQDTSKPFKDGRIEVLQSETTDASDKELAFQEIIEEFEKPLSFFIAKIIDSKDYARGFERAEDVLQDVFTRAWVAIVEGRFEIVHEQSLSAWLYQIARNFSINTIRDANKRPLDYTSSGGNPMLIAISSLQNKTVQPGEALEFREDLETLKNGLAERQFKTLVSAAAGFSYEELAEMEGVTIPAVKTAIHRGRTRSRGLLGDRKSISTS